MTNGDKTKSFRLDRKVFNVYQEAFNEYNQNGDLSHKSFMEELLYTWLLYMEKIKILEKYFPETFLTPNVGMGGGENDEIDFTMPSEYEDLYYDIKNNLDQAIKDEYKCHKKKDPKTYKKLDDYINQVAQKLNLHIDTIKNVKNGTTQLSAANVLFFEKEIGIHRDRILGNYYINPKYMYDYSGLKNLYHVYKEDEEIANNLSRTLNKLSRKLTQNKSAAFASLAKVENCIDDI